jgi:signal transduction histidine kinase
METSKDNRWRGRSAEEVLSMSFHEMRNPMVRLSGYLSILKSANLPPEDTQRLIDMALDCAVSVTDTVYSVYQYMQDQRENK